MNINDEIPKSNIKFIPIQNKSVIVQCVLFYSWFVCISAYANVYFQTTIIRQNIWFVRKDITIMMRCRDILFLHIGPGIRTQDSVVTSGTSTSYATEAVSSA